MKGKANIGAIVLGVIMALCITVGFFFLGFFCSEKEWISFKEPVIEDQTEDGNEDEQLPDEGNEDETGGEEVTLKAAAYTVSLKGGVETLAVGGETMTGVCPGCGKHGATYRVTAQATCTTGLRQSISHAECGYFGSTEGEPLGHDWGGGESVAATTEYCADTRYSCERCVSVYYAKSGTSARTAHSAEVTDSRESTCITEGFKAYTCSLCDYSWTETLSLAAHSYDSGKITKYETCTDEGVMTYTCTVCNIEKTEAIPATGHTASDDGIVSKEPTCTEEGVMTYICKDCGVSVEVIPIKALGHDFKIVEAEDPTCTDPGHGQYSKCARCSAVFGDIMEIPATGHVWTEWEETRVSCDVAGERTRTCTICGEEESEELEAGAHSWDDGVISKTPGCTESGIRTKTCVLCGDTMTETVAATGHKPAKMAAVAATCTKTGLTEGERCTACGITLTAQQVIPAFGHDMQYHAAVAATETAGGNIEYWQCNTCGVCYTDADGKTQISAEDTLTPPLGAEEDPGDENSAEDKEGLAWWAWALIAAGAVVVIGITLVIIDQAVGKNKAKSNGGTKSAPNNGYYGYNGNNGGNRNNYSSYNGNRKKKSKKR